MNRCLKCNSQTNTLFKGVCESCALDIARELAEKMIGKGAPMRMGEMTNMNNDDNEPKNKILEVARSIATEMDKKGFKLRTTTDFNGGDKMYILEAKLKDNAIGIYIYHESKKIKFFFAKMNKKEEPIKETEEKREFNIETDMFALNKYYEEVLQKIENQKN
jgi:hypothetical protein